MAKLGTESNPAIVRVQTQERAQQIMAVCDKFEWKVIVGVEGDKEERIEDFEQLFVQMHKLNEEQENEEKRIGRNDDCPCGSGQKYKKCCMNKENEE